MLFVGWFLCFDYVSLFVVCCLLLGRCSLFVVCCCLLYVVCDVLFLVDLLLHAGSCCLLFLFVVIARCSFRVVACCALVVVACGS